MKKNECKNDVRFQHLLKKFNQGSMCLLALTSVDVAAHDLPIANELLAFKNRPHTVSPIHQQKTSSVSGLVKDELGEPLIGANVMVKGTTTGVITDIDGKFILSVPANAHTLTVSYVGYLSKDVKINTKQPVIITLTENTEQLSEVVIVGYGTQKKESVVGAVAQVNNESLMKANTSDITSAIAGKLSGVLTMQQSGQPGSTTSEIIIRGVSSWNGSAPLVLIDGVERSFNDIDPNEVNTISVLKDASATAVFGAKGANGVIIVTTRRGTEGKIKLDVSASYGMEVIARGTKHIDAFTTMSMYNIAQKNQGKFQALKSEQELNEYRNPSSRLNALRYPDVDWFDLLTRDFAPVVNANINLQGGTKYVKYFASLGYTHQGSLFESFNEGHCDTRYKYDRVNYRINLDFDLTKSTVLTFNVGGNVSIQNSPATAPWEAMYQASSAMFPAFYPAWALDEAPDSHYPDASGIRLAATQDANDNPYSILYQGKFNQFTTSQLFTDLILKQNLDAITKGLSFTGKVALSTNYKNKSLTANWGFPTYELYFDRIGTENNPWKRTGESNDIWNQPALDINVGGLENGYYNNLYYELALNYQRSFGNHHVGGLALMNRQQKNINTDFGYFNESWVARATYDYGHRYLFEVNIGYTGSERFAPSNRFGFFPSYALGWVVSEEKFFKNNINWMSKLKLRYSDGKVGSDAASERWLYMSEYNKNGNYIYEGKVPNLTAQWEEARKRDIGIELGFLENMITASLDLYDEKRDKMLLSPKSNTMLVGNNGFKQLNKGKMKKHGLEIEAGFNKSTAYDLRYHFNAMIGLNENRILAKDDLPYAPDYLKEVNKPYGSMNQGVITTGNGYYNSVDDIHNYVGPTGPENLNVGDYRFLDYTADGRINVLDQYPIEGTLYPPMTFSFGGGFSYKNFDFNILFQGNKGKYVKYNESFEIEFNQASYRVHESQLDFWTPNNPNANHSTLHYLDNASSPILGWTGGDSYSGYSTWIRDRFWRKADYLRLKEIYLAYNFNVEKIKKATGISRFTVYASGNNVFTFTKLVEGDPERKDFSKGFYPQMSTYKLGIKVSF